MAAFSQKEGNTKIIVKVKDTTNLHKRVKVAFINLDFIVKDLEGDTLKTYPREFLDNAYLVANAVIDGDQVTLSGVSGSRKINFMGYYTSPKDFNTVIYFRGGVAWKLLQLVADGIGGEKRYE